MAWEAEPELEVYFGCFVHTYVLMVLVKLCGYQVPRFDMGRRPAHRRRGDEGENRESEREHSITPAGRSCMFVTSLHQPR